MTTKKIFNPLDNVAVCASTDQVSTSSLINKDVGVCPKCQQPMESAIIANNDEVFYCGACRVSSPKPDSLS